MYASSESASTYAADFITVNGFNLDPSAVRVVNSATATTSSVATDSGIAATTSNTASDYTSFSLANTIEKSGYLEVFTNGVRSLNNINENDAHDAAGSGSAIGSAVSDYANYYNREPDYYTTKNVQLTDDRYLVMWDMKQTNVTNGYYPNMVMEGDDPVFGYIDNNGGGGGPGGAPSSTAFYQRAKYDGSTADEIYKEYLGKSLVGDQMAMAKDDDGRYYQLSVSNYSGDYMTMYYDRFAELYTNNNVWCGVTQYSAFNGTYATGGTNNAIALDTIGSYTGRFQYPKVIAKGGSRTGTASVYMTYYDSVSGNIYIRNFMLGTTAMTGSSSGVKNRLASTGSDNNGNSFAQYINFAEGTTDYSARHSVVSGSGNKFFDMTVTDDNHIVVVYYDEDTSRLKLRYSTNAEKGANPTDDIDWSDFGGELPEYVGNYVSVTSDSDGGIHIAAFDVTDSDLSYIYIPDYTKNNYVHVSVDQFGSVGNWTKIKLNSAGIPYIAYCNATEYGQRDAIKIAYATSLEDSRKAGVADNTRYTTGNWEYMTVPAITPPQGSDSKFQQVCLDFDSSGVPVVGYLGTNLEFGKQRSE